MGRVHAETLELSLHLADDWRVERFLSTVELLSGEPPEKAEAVARATLNTLGERLSDEQARELSADLPEPLRAWLMVSEGRSTPFDVDEFIRRVANRTGTDEETAEREARAVLTALARVLREQEFDRLREQLPAEYSRLLHEAEKIALEPEAPDAVSRDPLVARVAQRTGLDPSQARRATEAVLETLAERIAGGEVEDIAEQLPEDLRPSLRRGVERTRGKAQKLSLDEFVWRIAEREEANYENALEHARAVFAALRETLTYKEFSDMLRDLPGAYYEALL
jgi:uncharacterized protein (DUF2267 family)